MKKASVSETLLQRLTPRRAAWMLLIAAVIAVALPAKAQSDAMLSQYYEVKNYYNAAAIGTGDMLNIRGAARLQWLGIENAPMTFILTGETPLKIGNRRIGLGAVVQSEMLGLFKNLTIGVQAGFKIKLFKGELTIGVQPAFMTQSFKGTDVFIPDGDDYHQSSDNAIPKHDLTGNSFDLGAGIYYARGNWWGGLSATHILQPSITLNPESSSSSENENIYEFEVGRSMYFMAGGNIPIKNTLFEVMPSVMVMTNLTFTTGEITARVRYNKFLTAGVGYRYNDAVTVTLGAVYKGFHIGYSYDYPVTSIIHGSSGSHEITAGYSLKLDFSEKNKNQHKSIRIM